jgi:hypothetical protein
MHFIFALGIQTIHRLLYNVHLFLCLLYFNTLEPSLLFYSTLLLLAQNRARRHVQGQVDSAG